MLRWVIAGLLPALAVVGPAPAEAAAVCSAPAVTSSAPVTWVDTAGITHVDGVLANTGGTASGVELHLSFVDASGAVARHQDTFPTLQTVGTGSAVGWDAAITPPAPTGAGHWQVDSIDAVPATTTVSQDFPLTTTSSPHQTNGPVEMTGTLANHSADTALFVVVSAVFHAADGSVAFVGRQIQPYLDIQGLAAGASQPWKLGINGKAPAWSTVTLTAEGHLPDVLADCTAAAAAVSLAPTTGLSHGPSLGTFGRSPVTDAPAVAPTSPSPDERPARVTTPPRPAPTSPSVEASSVSASAHRSSSSHVGWGVLAGVLVVLAGGGALLVAARLRATRVARHNPPT